MDKLFRSDEKLYVSPSIDLKAFVDEAYAVEDQFHKFFGGSSANVSQRVAFMKFMENRDYNCKQADRVINSVEFVDILNNILLVIEIMFQQQFQAFVRITSN